MVETQLVTDDIAIGKQALQALDRESVDVRSALWLYIPDASEWRLVFSMPVVDVEGQEAGYRLVQRALKRHSVSLPLRRITVLGVREPLVERLRRVLKTAPAPSSSNVSIGTSDVGGYLIQGAHVYRST